MMLDYGCKQFELEKTGNSDNLTAKRNHRHCPVLSPRLVSGGDKEIPITFPSTVARTGERSWERKTVLM